MERLRGMRWVVIATHGNVYQAGLPDLYCARRDYGSRWIECKQPINYSFTKAQCEVFPLLHSQGIGIWILSGYDDIEIAKLFKPANWMTYYLNWVNNARG